MVKCRVLGVDAGKKGLKLSLVSKRKAPTAAEEAAAAAPAADAPAEPAAAEEGEQQQGAAAAREAAAGGQAVEGADSLGGYHPGDVVFGVVTGGCLLGFAWYTAVAAGQPSCNHSPGGVPARCAVATSARCPGWPSFPDLTPLLMRPTVLVLPQLCTCGGPRPRMTRGSHPPRPTTSCPSQPAQRATPQPPRPRSIQWWRAGWMWHTWLTTLRPWRRCVMWWRWAAGWALCWCCSAWSVRSSCA